MKSIQFFLLIITSIFLVQCQREISFSQDAVPQPAIPAPITPTVQGNVLDENGLPADGVNIKVGTKTAVTDVKGYFRITDASLDKNASLVVAEKPGYFKAMRSFSATSGVNQVLIQLLPKTLAGTIDGTAGGSVTLNNGMKIALPANGVVNASGNAYTGSVNIYAAFIDPTSPEIDRIVPGSFMADDKNGGRVTLSSYGMMAVELESAGGEKLQVKNGSKATLTSPIPASLQSSAPANIAMWYVDESKGIWKEEGTGAKNGNNYVSEVSHFSFWNCDIGIPAVNISMTIKNNEGLPVVHALVKLSASNPFPTNSYGYTDSLGQVSGLVPRNQPLVLEVLDQCHNPIFTQNVGPFNQNSNLGNIVIPPTNNFLYLVSGTVIDCSNVPVTDGYIMMVHDNTVRYTQVDASGNFNLSFIKCASSPLDFQVYAVDANAMQQGNMVNATLSSQQTNVGNLVACGTSTEQYIEVVIDGVPNQVSSPLDSMAAYTYPDSSGGFVTYMSGNHFQGQTMDRLISLNFKHNVEGPGVYQATQIHTNDYPSFTTVIQPFNVNLTSYANNPGQFYEGSFSGSFSWGGSTHSVTGTFRLRRSW